MTAHAIVLFGATGDLAQRMLFPSLYLLDGDGLLPPELRVIGAARAEMDAGAFRQLVETAVRARAPAVDEAAWARFAQRLEYTTVDATDPKSFGGLATLLKGVGETVYYLSTSPSLYGAVGQGLRANGLGNLDSRVVVEKPIGRDLASCQAINDGLAQTFSEDRIFRIDHYLGKEAVQNLIALRFGNILFEPLWTNRTIEHVQITVAETVGLEGRAGYYDDYGAIRDMVQNHLLQLLCLVAMEPPASLDANAVRDEKVKVLRSLCPITSESEGKLTVRGQYVKGVSDSAPVPGYLDELGRPSSTETFTAIAATVDNWRWAGVPFYLRTGKRMAARASEIVVQFKPVPHSIFAGQELAANRLVIRLQPDEEISLTVMNKTPSLDQGGMQLRSLDLDLSLDKAFAATSRRRIAYERLLLEAIKGDPTLFVRRDEAEAAWRWIDGIIAAWGQTSHTPTPYPAGSWGPAGAFALTERRGHSWHE